MTQEYGKVLWYNSKRGFGIIVCGNGDQLFVHHSNIRGPRGDRIILQEKEKVFFERQNIDSKNQAINVYRHRKIIPITRNTIDFKPRNDDMDVRIRVGVKTGLNHNDISIINDFSKNHFDIEGGIFKKLFDEFKLVEGVNSSILKLWHSDTHLIVDDKATYSSPTFNYIIEKIKYVFNVNIAATRLNYYQDGEYKPLHFDAAAINPEKEAVQNITISASFGSSREIIFENAVSGTTMSIEITDGSVYTFGKIVNKTWRHGVKKGSGPRISVVCWGTI